MLADNLEPVKRLGRDLIKATATLSNAEARYLVDSYYQMQANRITAQNQIRSMGDTKEPHMVLSWVMDNAELLESQIKRALDAYSKASEIGKWSRDVKGVGPVIAAGLLAHIDITKAPTVGHIWRFAGLDPTRKWEKKQKRPWNASLKTLCWKLGESFVKVSGKDDAVYGKFYLQRKDYENAKNEKGDYREQAEEGMQRVGKTTEAYKSYKDGKLPKGHIHARAKRWTVKLFLSHWHEQNYQFTYGEKPPLPYPIAIQGHAHKI